MQTPTATTSKQSLPGFEEFESSNSAPPPKKKKNYKKAPEPFTTYYDDKSEDDGDLSNQLKNRKRKRSGSKEYVPTRSIHDRLGSPIKKEPIQEKSHPNLKYRYTQCKYYRMGHCIKLDACDFLHERPSQNYVNLEEEKEDSNNDSFDDYVPTENSSNRTVIVRPAASDDDIEEISL